MFKLYDVSSKYIDFGDFGKLYFTKVKDKDELYSYVPYLVLQKNELLDFLKDKNEILYDNLKINGLYNFLLTINKFKINKYGLYELYKGFKNLFLFCFKDDVFDKIGTEENFEYLRNLIVEINCIPYEKPNPNPDIEWFNQLERQIREKNGETVTFDAVYTSVWVVTGCCPDNMTLYQFYKLFYRIAQIKNFDVSALFKTVDYENKIKIESWAKDEDKTKDKVVSFEELKSKKFKL